MLIVRLGASSLKVTDDYRGFRKGVYVRVTEVNPEPENSPLHPKPTPAFPLAVFQPTLP